MWILCTFRSPVAPRCQHIHRIQAMPKPCVLMIRLITPPLYIQVSSYSIYSPSRTGSTLTQQVCRTLNQVPWYGVGKTLYECNNLYLFFKKLQLIVISVITPVLVVSHNHYLFLCYLSSSARKSWKPPSILLSGQCRLHQVHPNDLPKSNFLPEWDISLRVSDHSQEGPQVAEW